ncbi:hypothetical protein BVRB_2g038360 [Beta vulgaris subsp. vulgaris]|nr:hypothetical protein BVRB_2g038360 [Beta vulgaris subsp. vulgaris]
MKTDFFISLSPLTSEIQQQKKPIFQLKIQPCQCKLNFSPQISDFRAKFSQAKHHSPHTSLAPLMELDQSSKFPTKLSYKY